MTLDGYPQPTLTDGMVEYFSSAQNMATWSIGATLFFSLWCAVILVFPLLREYRQNGNKVMKTLKGPVCKWLMMLIVVDVIVVFGILAQEKRMTAREAQETGVMYSEMAPKEPGN